MRRQALGLLVDEQDVIAHPVAHRKIGPNHFGQGLAAPGGLGQGRVDTAFDFAVDGVAHQVKDILLAANVLVERPDGKTGGCGDFAGGGLVKPLIDEQLDGGIRDLAAAPDNKIGVFYVCFYIGRVWADAVHQRRNLKICDNSTGY
jgi:hypothetical protein